MKTNDCDMVKRKDNADGSIVENKTMADKFVLMLEFFTPSYQKERTIKGQPKHYVETFLE